MPPPSLTHRPRRDGRCDEKTRTGPFPLRVLYISLFTDLTRGGQKSLLALIEALDRRQIVPHAIVQGEGELGTRLRDAGCAVFVRCIHDLHARHVLRIRSAETRRCCSSVRWMASLVRRMGIDLVHVETPEHAVVSRLALLVSLRPQTQLVLHARLTAPHRLDRWAARSCDGIIAVSEAARNRFLPWIGAPGKARTIFNGIDLTRFHPASDRRPLRESLGLPPNRFFLLFAGQLKPGKGILDLINAMEILSREFPSGEGPFLVLAGETQDGCLISFLQEKIRSRSLQDRVRLIGHQVAIENWMRAADAVILPSHEGVEGMGRVLQEGMACGAIVLCSDISGCREAVGGECGLLFPPEDPEAMAMAIARVARYGQFREELAARGIRRAKERFGIERHAREVSAFYRELRGDRPAEASAPNRPI